MTLIRLDAKYVHEQANLRVGWYRDGSIALQATDEYGQPLCKPTVSLVDYGEKPADGNVFIRDYAENEGMLKALQDAGIIGAAIREVPCGFATAYECPLIMEVDGR
jgi:hypothetical protein